MKVIFLDFDGVIVVQGRVSPWAVASLNRIVEETQAVIVVSSHWRVGKNIGDLQGLLNSWGVQGHVVSKTPDNLDFSADRGRIIETWMEWNEPLDSFVILDDDADMEPLSKHLVQTDPLEGLSRDNADEAVSLLGGRTNFDRLNKPMKIMVLSEAGDAFGLVYKLSWEGHDVSMAISNSEYDDGGGLVDVVHDWNFQPDRDTLVVADATGMGAELDLLRKSGILTVGSGLLADKLEMDRRYANKVAGEVGMNVPHSQWFNDWDSAVPFINEAAVRLVFKPGRAFSGNVPSYVSNGSHDLLKMLSFYKRLMPGQPEFMLQEFKEGIDISTEGLFNGHEFMRPLFHTFEQKHLMPGNLGPSGGCTGNVVWACSGCPVCAGTVDLFEQFLRESDYGPCNFDINAVLQEDGTLWFLEITPRFGYDCCPTKWLALIDEDIGGLFHRCATGGHNIETLPGVAGGLRFTVSPWPCTRVKSEAGIPINGLKESMLTDRFYLNEVALDQDGDFVTTAGHGVVGVATAYGNDIDEVMNDCVKFCKRLGVPDAQYRVDLADEFNGDARKLERYLGVSVGA